jgi:hypothetical protein
MIEGPSSITPNIFASIFDLGVTLFQWWSNGSVSVDFSKLCPVLVEECRLQLILSLNQSSVIAVELAVCRSESRVIELVVTLLVGLALGLGVARCRSPPCVVPLSRPALQKLEGLTADEAASQVSTGGSASTSTPSQRRGRVAEPPVP